MQYALSFTLVKTTLEALHQKTLSESNFLFNILTGQRLINLKKVINKISITWRRGGGGETFPEIDVCCAGVVKVT